MEDQGILERVFEVRMDLDPNSEMQKQKPKVKKSLKGCLKSKRILTLTLNKTEGQANLEGMFEVITDIDLNPETQKKKVLSYPDNTTYI